MWANTPDDAWAILGLGPYHWDGCSWTLLSGSFGLGDAGPVGATALAFWGTGPTDTWAAVQEYPSGFTDGPESLLMERWDGQSWTVMGTLPMDGAILAGSGSDDIWVSDGYQLGHYNGQAWALWTQ
jgi:hypothetical protein